jgi:hypothetical protein
MPSFKLSPGAKLRIRARLLLIGLFKRTADHHYIAKVNIDCRHYIVVSRWAKLECIDSVPTFTSDLDDTRKRESFSCIASFKYKPIIQEKRRTVEITAMEQMLYITCQLNVDQLDSQHAHIERLLRFTV